MITLNIHIKVPLLVSLLTDQMSIRYLLNDPCQESFLGQSHLQLSFPAFKAGIYSAANSLIKILKQHVQHEVSWLVYGI